MPLTLQSSPFGPLVKGVADSGDASLNLAGYAKSLKGVRFAGAGKLQTREGTRVVLTLKDDAGTPATITSVVALVPFADGCLLVGHSTVTDKVYLYRLNATLDTWTDSGGTTHTTAAPEPVGVLWTACPDAPVVTVTEGLGVAYIAHTTGADAASLSFPLKQFTDSSRAVATVTSDVNGDSSAEDIYALGCVAFQQHLWIWGFGAGTTAANAYRPELARFSQPNFSTSPQLFATSDSLTLGNRVRSLREGIIGGFVAGEALFLGAPYLVTRVTGYGRSSWYKQPLENSYGFVSPSCAVAVGSTLYWWSPRGPMRCGDSGPAEGLFDAVAGVAETVVNPQSIIAGFDSQKDLVIFSFDTGSGVRTWAGYDVRRELWIGPDNDWGLTIASMGTVTPIYAASAAASLGPTAAPSGASTDTIGGSTAAAHWTDGDATSPTSVEYRVQGTSSWTVATVVGAGITSYTFTGLAHETDYEWRVAHLKDGQYSTYLGPSVATQFTTLTLDDALLPPTNVSLSFSSTGSHAEATNTLTAYWTNSGEAAVMTDVELSPTGDDYVLQQTAPNGVSSADMNITASGTYYVRLRHVKAGAAPSAYTTPVSMFVTAF